mmetsp:Transcript_17161/g.27765  ORF Transcript_17161/g.27765 Transcript_17161/m.27765 type:complete len:171 (-) Transcript_17161:42-554(-)
MGAVLGVEEKANHVRDLALQHMAAQREMQMAVNMARMRDMVQYFSGLWAGCVTVGLVAAARGHFPKPLAVPILILPLGIAYQADMAYYTKIRRVSKEAEYIIANERWRFIPPEQAPFYKFYEKEVAELAAAEADSGRVGLYWPTIVRDVLEGPVYRAAVPPPQLPDHVPK